MPDSSSQLLERVATAPISWGVCEVPGWGQQLPPERVLAEMRQLGFTHTELGASGWLPDSPDELRALLARHDLQLLAAFVPLVLHEPHQTDATLEEAARAAELLAAGGATYFNTAPVTSRDWKPRDGLTDQQWEHLFATTAQVDAICADHGLKQVLHEHVGCVIETAEEVRTFLDNTTVDLVLDTGHLAIGGFDPVEVATKHADRVGLVHLKDLNLGVAEKLNAGDVTLMEAVQQGLFPALGQGDLDIAGVISALSAVNCDGWYVIEQDCAIDGGMPAPGRGPVEDVALSLDFLRSLGGQK